MTEQEIEQDAKAYRQYREDCGYKDPVALDEIESAYYMGMIKMKEMMMLDAVDSEAVLNYYGKNSDKEYYTIGNEEVDGEKYNLHDGDKLKLIIIKEERI